jgi:hypothetical protein
MPPVQFFARLDLEQICLFPDGHEIVPHPSLADLPDID